jgi:hypothetical protein
VNIRPAGAATATVDAAELRAALARLGAASARDDGNPAVGLVWSDGGAVALCLAHEDGTAVDSIAATTAGSARIAVAAAMLGKLIEATGAAQVRMSVGEGPGTVLRIDGGDATAIIAPIYWATRPQGPLGK